MTPLKNLRVRKAFRCHLAWLPKVRQLISVIECTSHSVAMPILKPWKLHAFISSSWKGHRLYYLCSSESFRIKLSLLLSSGTLTEMRCWSYEAILLNKKTFKEKSCVPWASTLLRGTHCFAVWTAKSQEGMARDASHWLKFSRHKWSPCSPFDGFSLSKIKCICEYHTYFFPFLFNPLLRSNQKQFQ